MGSCIYYGPEIMIAAVDVHYKDDGAASAGAVVFADYSDSTGYRTYIRKIARIEDYIPGQFSKREMPGIMTTLGIIEKEIKRRTCRKFSTEEKKYMNHINLFLHNYT
jgi:deoxyinosine 3'endonuclease (endonuclease V)